MIHDGSVEVVIHHEDEDDSFWAEVSDMPGCFAAADSLAELEEVLTDAIALWVTPDDGRPLPNVQLFSWPSSWSGAPVEADEMKFSLVDA